MTTSRERKLKFLKDGNISLRVCVTDVLAQHGTEWLTDDQVGDLVRYLIQVEKRMLSLRRNNRKAASARRGRDEAA